MKAITKIFLSIFILTAIILGCEESDQIIGETIYEGPSFLRFYLITNSNGELIEDSEVEIGRVPTEEYTHKSLKPLYIPVSLTHTKIDNEITADVSTNLDGTFDGLTLSSNQVNFNKNKLIDSLLVTFTERWNPADSIKIDLELTNCSDKSVSLA